MRFPTLLITGLLAAGGCAHTSANDVAQSTRSGFATAYDAVKTGVRKTAEGGGWVLAKAADGTVSVMRSAGLRGAANYTEDRVITSKIKGNYAVDRDVKARRINVDTDHGIVTLTGVVDDSFMAERAIRIAIDTPGVTEVHSNLQFPTTNEARIYKHGDQVKLRAKR